MTELDNLKQAGICAMAEQLMILRCELTQEEMAEKCDISLRHYSDLERRITSVSAVTLLNLYRIGFDLNKWADVSLQKYRQYQKQ